MRVFVALGAAADSWWAGLFDAGFCRDPAAVRFYFRLGRHHQTAACATRALPPQPQKGRQPSSAVCSLAYCLCRACFAGCLQQNTLHGVVTVVIGAAIAMGLLALLYNAISKDVEEFPDPPGTICRMTFRPYPGMTIFAAPCCSYCHVLDWGPGSSNGCNGSWL